MYVPLDVDYPPERLAFMVEDSHVTLIISDTPASHLLPTFADRIRTVDQVVACCSEDSHDALTTIEKASAGDLAYVIHTLGSTGQPEGTDG